MLFKRIFEELTFFGGIGFYLFVSLYFLFKGMIDIFFVMMVGLFIIYLITFIIRIFYFKKRPREIKYKNILEKLDASSFPSVHAARITLLFILVIILTNNFMIWLLALLLSIAVLYSRIVLKKHYYTDLIGGILLGILTSTIFFYVV